MGVVGNASQSGYETLLSPLGGNIVKHFGTYFFECDGVSVPLPKDPKQIRIYEINQKVYEAKAKQMLANKSTTNPFNTNESEKSDFTKKYEERMAKYDKQLKEYGILAGNAATEQNVLNTKISSLFSENGSDTSLWSLTAQNQLADYKEDLSNARWSEISARNGEFSVGIDKFLAACHFGKQRINEMFMNMLNKSLDA